MTGNYPHRPFSLPMREVFRAAIREMARPAPSVRLSAWTLFNDFVGGFRPREFSILCAPTGCGKTEFLAAISAQLLPLAVKHFVMSVETGHTDFVRRVLSNLTSIDLNDGEVVPPATIAHVSNRTAEHVVSDSLELSLYDNRVPVETLCADLRYWAERGHKVAMIDNMNFFMEVRRASDQIVEMDRVLHELIILCKQIDMHVIMVMHPRKTENGRVESEYDIKGSSTAVQEAHNVFLLNRPREQDIATGHLKKYHRELRLAKLRRRGRYQGREILFAYESNAYAEVGSR